VNVTAGHRSAGTSRRRSVLEASDLSVEQARFPVLFPRNVERDLVADENRRDLRRFPAGGRLHSEPRNSTMLAGAFAFGDRQRIFPSGTIDCELTALRSRTTTVRGFARRRSYLRARRSKSFLLVFCSRRLQDRWNRPTRPGRFSADMILLLSRLQTFRKWDRANRKRYRKEPTRDATGLGSNCLQAPLSQSARPLMIVV
jgi:hypothetical protein